MDIISVLFNWLFEIFKDKQTAYTLATILIVSFVIIALAVVYSFLHYRKRIKPLSDELSNIIQSASGTQERRRIFAERFENLREKFQNSPLDHCWFEFEEVIIQDTQKGLVRKVLKEIHSAVKENNSPSEQHMSTLTKQFTSSYSSVGRQLKEDEHAFEKKLSFLTPKGGIVHNNVQRMLLANGPDKYLQNVPMAIFVEDKQT